jgi:hypothetical protein
MTRADGYGDGRGYGYGSGSGHGYGYGYGDGDGDGDGYGYGHGYGYGAGRGTRRGACDVDEWPVSVDDGRIHIGCLALRPSTWRRRWRTYAARHGVPAWAARIAMRELVVLR